MTPTVVERGTRSDRDRVADTVHQVAHEARLLKTLTADAVEDGLHAARRTMTRTRHNLEDMRDLATVRIRRSPLRTAAMVFGAGVLLGGAAAWAIGWFRRDAVRESDRFASHAVPATPPDPFACVGEVRR